MKQWLQRFMAGRHGTDELSFSLLMLYLGLFILAGLLDSELLTLLSTALVIYIFFRILSRNTTARRKENEQYLLLIGALKARRTARKAQKADKDHVYYRCKKCGAVLRVPKGAGKIEITCPKCGNILSKKV